MTATKCNGETDHLSTFKGACVRGSIIDAIKAYREMTGATFREAHKFIELNWVELRQEDYHSLEIGT